MMNSAILTALWLEETIRDYSALPEEAQNSMSINPLDFPIKELRSFVFVYDHSSNNYDDRINIKCLGMVSASEIESIKIIPALRMVNLVKVRLKEGIYNFKLDGNGNVLISD